MPADHLLNNFTQFASSKKSLHQALFHICAAKKSNHA